MQVQAINNNQPSFGAIKIQCGLLNNKNRKVISDFITEKLYGIDSSDKLKRSFVERAEHYGYDVLFSKGEKGNSVRVDVVDTLEQQKAAVWNGTPISDFTYVGTYSKPEQFDIKDFNNTYRQNEKTTKFYVGCMTGLLGALITATVGLLFAYAVKKDLTSAIEKPNTTIVAKDSLKTDSIKPILEDSLKLGKKIIKK